MKNYESRLLEANNEARYLSEYCNGDNLNEVNGYHSFSNWSFKKANDTDANCYIGVELETTNDRKNFDYKTGRDLNNLVRDTRFLTNYQFVAEKDSSIGNGIEFISQPSTIEYWYSIKDKVSDAFDYLTDKGMISDEANKLDINCGLHFHISKNYLGNTQEEINNTIDFIWLLLENFKTPLQKLARRESNIYTQFLSDYLGSGNLNDKYKSYDFIKKCDSKDATRYFALNLRKDKTIEFRFIKGTLNINTFYASIELVKNIVDLAKNCNGDINKLIGKSLKDLLVYNNSQYLMEYAKTRSVDFNVKIVDTTCQLERLLALQMKRKSRDINKSLTTYNENVLKDASLRIDKQNMQYALNCLFDLYSYRKYLKRFIDIEKLNIYNISPYLSSNLDTKEKLETYYNERIKEKIDAVKKIDLRELKRHLVQEIVKHYLENDRNFENSDIIDKYKTIMGNITDIKNWSER